MTKLKKLTRVGHDDSVVGEDVLPKKREQPPTRLVLVKTMELSITVGVGGTNIDVSLLTKMDALLQSSCSVGVCSMERGGALSHLHFQMECRLLQVV